VENVRQLPSDAISWIPRTVAINDRLKAAKSPEDFHSLHRALFSANGSRGRLSHIFRTAGVTAPPRNQRVEYPTRRGLWMGFGRGRGDLGMQAELILLTVGVGLTVLATIVVFVSMRRGAAPTAPDGLTSSAAPAPTRPVSLERQSAVVAPDKIILRGLQALLERDAADAFVIFEHPPTKRFVQFTRTDDGVMLDFPLIELSADERDRASALFAPRGLPPTQFSGDGGSVDIYQAGFGRDVDRAAGVACEIFRKVFNLHGDFPRYVKTE
jgi:hypothetical protein